MSWRMLHFSDLQCMPIPEQLFAFSDACLQSADILCATLCSSVDRTTYAHGAVIMSLTFHALELFLKAAILQEAPMEEFRGPSGHDLDLLYKRYSDLYPSKVMHFYIPFKRELPDIKELDPQVAKELLAYVRELNKTMPVDQFHRYPISVKGEAWEGAFGFESQSFSKTLQDLKHELTAIKCRMKGG